MAALIISIVTINKQKRKTALIGKKRAITSKSELLTELSNASFDKVAVFEGTAAAEEAGKYIKKNQQWHHSIIVIGHR